MPGESNGRSGRRTPKTIALGRGPQAAVAVIPEKEPAESLVGLLAQLDAGIELSFDDDLEQLARRVVARGADGPHEDNHEWAARLAKEAAGLID